MLAKLPDHISHLMFISGVALLTLWLMMRLIRRRRQGPMLTPLEQVERNKQLRGMRGDLEELMVQIEQLAKRLGAQLDVKAMRLEKLLAEADQKLEELRRLQGAEPSRPTSSGGLPPSSPAAVDPGPPDDPLARSVYQLADAGNTSIEIARQLKEHVGKVELILALRHSA